MCYLNKLKMYDATIKVSSTCFGNPSVHPQEDLYMQFYGISLMHPYKQSGRWNYNTKHILKLQHSPNFCFICGEDLSSNH